MGALVLLLMHSTEMVRTCRNHDYGESALRAPEKCPAADPDCFYSPLHEVCFAQDPAALCMLLDRRSSH